MKASSLRCLLLGLGELRQLGAGTAGLLFSLGGLSMWSRQHATSEQLDLSHGRLERPRWLSCEREPGGRCMALLIIYPWKSPSITSGYFCNSLLDMSHESQPTSKGRACGSTLSWQGVWKNLEASFKTTTVLFRPHYSFRLLSGPQAACRQGLTAPSQPCFPPASQLAKLPSAPALSHEATLSPSACVLMTPKGTAKPDSLETPYCLLSNPYHG